MIFVALFVLAACDDDRREHLAFDAQEGNAPPAPAANDDGCAFCLPYDAGTKQAADAAEPDADSCKLVDPPPCNTVACTWTDAQQKLPECPTPPLTPFYAARCGDFDALASRGTDSIGYHIYDATGRLVAIRWLGLGGYCRVFDEAFQVPERCELATPDCSQDADAGM
jgi:hypothetical protein